MLQASLKYGHLYKHSATISANLIDIYELMRRRVIILFINVAKAIPQATPIQSYIAMALSNPQQLKELSSTVYWIITHCCLQTFLHSVLP